MRRASFLAFFFICLIAAPHPDVLAEGAVATGKMQPRQWFGVAINKPSLQQARNDAMSICSQSGPNCSVLTTFRNTCIAITWGDTRGRSGYAATTRQNLDDARSAAMSYCYSNGMARCEIRYAGCDTIDEAEVTRQRSAQQQREAEQRRQDAEEAARQARQRELASRQAEQEANRHLRDLAERRNQILVPAASAQSGDFSVSNKKALSLAILLVLGTFVVILKQGYPQLAGWTALIVPAASLGAYLFFGFELKSEVTLAEWSLFAPIFGGMIVAGIAWKLST